MLIMDDLWRVLCYRGQSIGDGVWYECCDAHSGEGVSERYKGRLPLDISVALASFSYSSCDMLFVQNRSAHKRFAAETMPSLSYGWCRGLILLMKDVKSRRHVV